MRSARNHILSFNVVNEPTVNAKKSQHIGQAWRGLHLNWGCSQNTAGRVVRHHQLEAMMVATDPVTAEVRDAQRKQAAERVVRREGMFKRLKDIAWTAVIASAITVTALTWLGWL